MSEKKTLIFLSADYPNGDGEIYVENEIKFISRYFDKIILINSYSKQLNSKRFIPENTEIVNFNTNIKLSDKIRSIKYIGSRVFWNELFIILFFYKKRLTVSIIKTLFVDLFLGKSVFKLLKSVLKKQYNDKIYVYSYWNDYRAIGCAFLKQKYPHIKFISRAHNWDIYFERSVVLYLPLRNFIVKQMDKNYLISQHGLNYLNTKLFKKNHTKLDLSYLGIYNNENRLVNYQDNKKLVVASCSYIHIIKRLFLLIDSFSKIDSIEIHWIHFGNGIDFEETKIYANNKLNNKKNITYNFIGHITNDKLFNYYNLNYIDLFINVSSYEGLPVSIMEAISFGIPVIATNVGGTSEIVNEKNGYLLSPNPDSSEIIENIINFYNLSDESKKCMRQNALDIWKLKFNAKKNYQKFIENVMKL